MIGKTLGPDQSVGNLGGCRASVSAQQAGVLCAMALRRSR